jgi:hypothetical protein
MSSPDLTADDRAAVNAVLQTPVLSIGPQIAAFERAAADCVGARYGVGVNSGTAGLHLGVIAAGVEQGDWVITTPFSFIASANAILYERGIPILSMSIHGQAISIGKDCRSRQRPGAETYHAGYHVPSHRQLPASNLHAKPQPATTKSHSAGACLPARRHGSHFGGGA